MKRRKGEPESDRKEERRKKTLGEGALVGERDCETERERGKIGEKGTGHRVVSTNKKFSSILVLGPLCPQTLLRSPHKAFV